MIRANPFLFLDDARPGKDRLSLYADPVRTITAFEPGEIKAALAALDVAVKTGFHAAGYFSYELGYFMEPRLARSAPKRREVPLLWFAICREKTQLAGNEAERWIADNVIGRAYSGPLHFLETFKSYGEKFRRAADYIAAGDIYQVNLTFPGAFRFVGDPLALYARLRARSAMGHGAYLFDGTRDILSFSPELFFRIEEGRIVARPMKGTAPRGSDEASDLALRDGLARSPKDRAENLMIVDLIRNDLGRIAKTGTVEAKDLFAVETYPTVHQMVSTVRAELREGITIEELLRAVFPCGSVTGTPKIRAMEIIRELEEHPRGLYCGAIGAFEPDGSAQFNVSIRTLTITGDAGTLGVGSAVVADSGVESEYRECLLKARYYTEDRPAIGLFEALRYEPGSGLIRAGRHIGRLVSAAADLGIPLDGRAVLEAMQAACRDATSTMRVRASVAEDGTLSISAVPFVAPDADTVWKYVYSEHRVPSGDGLARHKTSWRTLYDNERAAWTALGADEIVFLNEQGRIVEASISNVFAQLDGRLVTPPLSEGALDGCLRRSLLDSGECIEGELAPADLERAEAVYFGNSVRGLIRGMRFTAS